MTASLNIVLQPLYLNSGRGRIFALFTPPADNKEVLLFLPSFGEELNRCRVMVAMQARKLAALGYGCLLIDYYGTGDSQGDFSETDWQTWHDNAETAYRWLIDQGHQRIGLWGLRLGAILAAEMAQYYPDGFTRLLLWQPVLDGKTFLTQFMRIRLAMLMDRNEPKETTQQMRDYLQQGHHLEVAGYLLSPQFATEIDSKKLVDYTQIGPNIPVDWFEAITEPGATLLPACEKVTQAWLQQGLKLTVHTYTGPFFWQLHERELTPELLKQTTDLLTY